MTARERLLLLVFFGGVLFLLARPEPGATAVGAAAGGVVGVLLAGRVHRLGRRMDERLGEAAPSQPQFSVRRPLVRIGIQLTVLGGLFLTTVFIPFVGNELYAAAAAAVTALPAVLTAARLRR